jgi:hypothetical protein
MKDHVQTRKQAAVQLLKLVVAGRFDEAYQEHADLRGKHHNPFFPAGFPALKKSNDGEPFPISEQEAHDQKCAR